MEVGQVSDVQFLVFLQVVSCYNWALVSTTLVLLFLLLQLAFGLLLQDLFDGLLRVNTA